MVNKPALQPGAPEIVQKKTVEVLTERIRLLGVDRSGAYEHYNYLLGKGFPIPPYEIAILDLVKRRVPDLRSYHEIGSGMGTLPFMLAHDGFATVGIERDDRRHLTAMTILRELAVDQPHIENNCRLIGASFPDAVADLDVSESMAIVTDFVSSQSPQDYSRICRELSQYRYVLLDLQRFCIKRDAKVQQDELLEELVSYGLAPCADTIDLGSQGLYRLLERKSPAIRPQQDVPAQSPVGTDVAVVPQPSPLATVGRSAGPALTKASSTALEAAPPSAIAAPAPALPEPSRGVILPPLPQRAQSKRFGGWVGLSALLVIGIPSILAVAYFGFLASSQFVTTFQFAVRGASLAASGRAPSASGGLSGAGAMSPDAFVIADYINSPQAISDVERGMDLKGMFAKPSADFWSRLAANSSAEQLNAFWNRMVWAHFDLISGNVSVSVRAFTPQDSLQLARGLIASSNEMFRRLNLQAQQDFVRAANDNLARAEKQLSTSRQTLLAFREKNGLLDVDKTAQAGASIIDDMRKQLAGLQFQYAGIRATAPKSPMLGTLKQQIAALENEIKNTDQQGASGVTVVSPVILGQYQSLDLERQFAEKQYTDALALKAQAYLIAQNQQSYLALFDEPGLAQTSLYPDRLKSILTVILAAAVAWFVGMLITYAIRDHLA